MEFEQKPFFDFVQLLHQWLSDLRDIPAVFWYINNANNKITFFNKNDSNSFNTNVSMLLQNQEHAKGIVFSEDFETFSHALQCAKNQQPMSVVFRIRDEDGETRWMVLLGLTAPDASPCYVGLLACCTSLVLRALGLEKGVTPLESIELMDSPVLLVRFPGKQIAHANQAARALFRFMPEETLPLFDTLFANGSEQSRQGIYENLIFNNFWRGAVTLQDRQGQPFFCSARIRPLVHRGASFLWVKLQPLFNLPQAVPPQASQSVARFSQAQSEEELLHALLAAGPGGIPAEGVMLSRIFIDEDKVVVTGVGDPCKGKPHRAEYPYIGSIAENLVRFGLDHLVVEETTMSTRPIDWVLFIPNGIHSYYAEPYFEMGKLKYVLIFCSTVPNTFNALNSTVCRDMIADFARNLARVDARS
ncbi:MAG: hypothetical protein AUJ49_07265 [Desulfovibrionaceae bacterium CG1_02_65_16]|nr:MAG: hypothetical protein AUJ49_07265 [Desulfovibrionaceae bacterium CG1_02_65_16]